MGPGLDHGLLSVRAMKTWIWLRTPLLACCLIACGDKQQQCTDAKKSALDAISDRASIVKMTEETSSRSLAEIDPHHVDDVRSKLDEAFKSVLALDCRRLENRDVPGDYVATPFTTLARLLAFDFIPLGGEAAKAQVKPIIELADSITEGRWGTPTLAKWCSSMRDTVAEIQPQLSAVLRRARADAEMKHLERETKLATVRAELTALRDWKREVAAGRPVMAPDAKSLDQVAAYQSTCH